MKICEFVYENLTCNITNFYLFYLMKCSAGIWALKLTGERGLIVRPRNYSFLDVGKEVLFVSFLGWCCSFQEFRHFLISNDQLNVLLCCTQLYHSIKISIPDSTGECCQLVHKLMQHWPYIL